MTPVARWSTKGMFAGATQKLREMPGNHRWLVRFERVMPPDETLPKGHEHYGKDIVDHRDVTCDEPIPLPALGPFANAAMQDLFSADGHIVAKSLTWTAYRLPKRGRA